MTIGGKKKYKGPCALCGRKTAKDYWIRIETEQDDPDNPQEFCSWSHVAKYAINIVEME